MQPTGNIRSYNIIVDAPCEVLYDVVTDLANLPRWALHFCKSARLTDDGAAVMTARGEVYFGTTGDRDLGVIDWWSGPTMQTAERWPTRVIPLPDGRSLYQVTALLPDVVPPAMDSWFADELGALKQLVEEQHASAIPAGAARA